MEVLSSAGPWSYPLLVVAALMIVAILRAWSVIYSDAPLPPAAPPHNVVVAWGVVGLLVGALGTVVGIARLAGGLGSVFEQVDPEIDAVFDLLAEGALVVAAPLVLGLSLFIVSVLAWMLLGWALNLRRRDPKTSGPDA